MCESGHMSGKDDKEWVPSKVVKHWIKKNAQRTAYQRNRGRLVKLDQKEQEENLSDLETLSQASGLSVSVDKLYSVSAPVTRTHSLDELYEPSRNSESTENLKSRPLSVCSVDDSTEKLEVPHRKKGKTEVKDLSKGVPQKSSDSTKMNLEEIMQRLAVSVEKDNHKLLPPLPYFNGETEKLKESNPQGPWIVYNCDEFLTHIEDATSGDKWTEAGRLRTLQDKLLSTARDYWRVKGAEVNTFALAKAYMLRRFPNTETFSTIHNKIAEFRRKPGESVSGMATRIQLLYEKLATVAPDTKQTQQLNMKELFFINFWKL